MTATKLVYSREELLRDHAYAKPQIEAGYRLHGGFDAAGTYISPRTLIRWPAVKAWAAEVERRGFPLIDATVKLLKRGSYPSREQQSLLLAHGLGQTLWNALSVTGVIEARGRVLCELTAPDFQTVVVEDLTATATGHLNKGLLFAHGLDEGGNPAGGEGGHDAMWFAARDLVFGKDAYPHAEIPESLARPEYGRRMPQIPKEYEDWILLLMNVLMIEVRAESFFAFCVDVMRSPENFKDRRADALHAAELVERIRTDEAIHVAYLQAFVSELRSFHFKTGEGKTVPGSTFIDPVWEGMIEWHAVTSADYNHQQTRDAVVALIKTRPDAAKLLDRFDALERKEAA